MALKELVESTSTQMALKELVESNCTNGSVLREPQALSLINSFLVQQVGTLYMHMKEQQRAPSNL